MLEPMDTSQSEIEAGIIALQSAAWAQARTHFENAVRIEDIPEAHDGLGIALWWLNDVAGMSWKVKFALSSVSDPSLAALAHLSTSRAMSPIHSACNPNKRAG